MLVVNLQVYSPEMENGNVFLGGFHLQECLFLLHVFVNERHELLWLSLSTCTPVLLPAVLLLQTLEDSTHLERQTLRSLRRQTGRPAGWQTGLQVVPAAMSCRRRLMR